MPNEAPTAASAEFDYAALLTAEQGDYGGFIKATFAEDAMISRVPKVAAPRDKISRVG